MARRAFGHTGQSGDAVCTAVALWEDPANFWDASQSAAVATTDFPTERAVHAVLVRDIFGNPFRPVAADPAWLTSTVVSLAAGIYAGRAFDRMPILADALMDAGCHSPEVRCDCRGPGPHARGYWVVDLVLGKK